MKNRQKDITLIGAGLTGLTLAYYLKKFGKNVCIIEKESRVGGVIQTVTEKGFTFETGPNTGVIGSPELVEPFDDLRNDVTLQIADPEAKNRWIWKNGKWHALPSGLFSAIGTPLFSLRDKFRILGEPFRKPGNNPNETVAELVKRRMGNSFLDYAVDPFISGIYAGNPSALITRFALPKLYNLEQNYGSFIKGAIKKRREPKTEIEKRVSRDVFSVKGGLENLMKALEQAIGEENIYLKASNVKVHQNEEQYLTEFVMDNKKQQIDSQYVISTINGANLAEIFPFLPKNLLQPMAQLDYARVVQVVACYTEWKGKKLDAFGGLVPGKENRNALGILFPSSLFKDRAPQNGAILSVFMGGIKKPEVFALPEEEIKSMALNEIKITLRQTEAPDVLHIYKYKHAIPQYEISSGERFDAIEKIQNMHKGLILAGNIRDGIGIADRVKQAKKIAHTLK